MPDKISRSVKVDVTILDAKRVKETDIAKNLDVSLRTVQRVKNKYRKYGDVEGGVKKRGRKSLMDPEMENVSLLSHFFGLLIMRFFFK
jgi:transposase